MFGLHQSDCPKKFVENVGMKQNKVSLSIAWLFASENKVILIVVHVDIIVAAKIKSLRDCLLA